MNNVSEPLILFVAMPGTSMGQSAQWNNPDQIKRHFFQEIRDELEKSIHRQVKLTVEKDELLGGTIHPSMYRKASEADIYIADLTGNNANVYLELGVRWALKDNVTILVSQNINSILFNASPNRAFEYDGDRDKDKLVIGKIVEAIKQGLEHSDHCDSPVRERSDILSYPKKYIQQLEEENKRLKSERGKDYLNAGKAEKSPEDRIKMFRSALQENDLLDEGHYLLGVELHKLAQYNDAITSLRRAILLNPRTAIYHKQLAISYSRINQLEDALTEFDESLQLDPNDGDAWSSRGGTLRRLGTGKSVSDYNWSYMREARDSYEKAYSLDRLDHYALGNIARLDLILSKVEPNRKSEALRELQKLRNLCNLKLLDDPEEKYWLLFDVADTYLLAGDVTGGLQQYDVAVQSVPADYLRSVLLSPISTLENILAVDMLDDDIKEGIRLVIEELKKKIA